jgi:hypothetical protein
MVVACTDNVYDRMPLPHLGSSIERPSFCTQHLSSENNNSLRFAARATGRANGMTLDAGKILRLPISCTAGDDMDEFHMVNIAEECML